MADNKAKNNEGNQFSSWVKVSNKGQIAIPIGIRKKMNINIADRLLIVIRKNKDGINLIKSEALDNVFDKYRE